MELRLPAEPIAPALARAGIRGAAPDLPDRTAADLALLLTELVSNAVRHASQTPGDEIRVRLYADDPVRVEVVDTGPGFEPLALASSVGVQSSGWGLILLDRIASTWGVEHGLDETTVWFELGARPRTRPPGSRRSPTLPEGVPPRRTGLGATSAPWSARDRRP
jgi:sigma-B regulation protein RsbU (phosphoserine phosphatase)